MTHRCHNCTFLLKFARDRDAYRRKIREHLRPFDIAILDYCITSNHVHLLMETPRRSEMSGFMQVVEGEFARAYNRRKSRMNAFWGDNYHATLVESGGYLWSCLCYIELNMVRCGVVKHPREWKWVGYHEIMGTWRRHRLIDMDRLCWRLGTTSLEEIRRNLEVSLAERIAKDQLKREPRWTESLAVGSISFLEEVEPEITSRRRTEMVNTTDDIWVLREDPISYRPEKGSEKRAIG